MFLSIIIICQKRAREIQQKDILYTVIKQAKNLSRIKGNDCSVLETTTVQNLVWTTLYLGTFQCSFPPDCPKKQTTLVTAYTWLSTVRYCRGPHIKGNGDASRLLCPCKRTWCTRASNATAAQSEGFKTSVISYYN